MNFHAVAMDMQISPLHIHWYADDNSNYMRLWVE